MMMTRVLLLLVLFLAAGPVALADASSEAEAEARTVLLRYFDALTQGDVSTLRSLMGGELLEKRSRLLDNPTYPEYLVETYQQARFEIERYAVMNEDSIAIDAVIVFPTDESMVKRFLLTRAANGGQSGPRYRVHDEQVVTQ
jgi:hypothetical protein